MSAPLDLAQRLDDCWLDIVAPDAKLATFARCANLMQEAAKLLRSLGIPRDISSAPDGDGWILGYDPNITDPGRSPWVPMTRGDGGWYDDGVDDYQPTMWVPLPDPQPEPSGWRPAEGHVEIGAGMLQGKPVFIATVIKPDGTQDIPRDALLASTADKIRADAARWANELGLSVVDRIDANVVPFRLGEHQS